jgi:ligand-binding SRPBCC domain-containing protein
MTETEIEAPIEICFDLARNIDIHSKTVWKHTKEKAINGTMTGMIGEGEQVTFEATHFLVRQTLAARITTYRRPYTFVDEMLSGAFKSMKHEHDFIDKGNMTLMRDTLTFEAPFGPLGWIVERIILKPYMKNFLEYRNKQLKGIAESKYRIN